MLRSFSLLLIFLLILSCNKAQEEEVNLLKKFPPKVVIEKTNKLKDSPEKFHTLAISYALLKDYNKAEEYYKKSLDLDRDNIKVMLNYSKLKAKKGEIKKSLSMVKSIKSKDNNLLITLAQIYLTLNSPDRAIREIQKIDREKLTVREIKDIVTICHVTKSHKLMAEFYEYYLDKEKLDYKTRINILNIIKKLRI